MKGLGGKWLSLLLIVSTNLTGSEHLEYRPDNTVFLIDFHHVIGRFDLKAALANFWNNPKKLQTAGRLFTYSMKKFFHTSPFKTKKESVLEYYLNKREKSPEVIRANNNLVNSFIIDQKTFALLKKLKERGYKLVLFSNIPDLSLHVQQTRHPELFNLFDALWVRTAENKYTSKTDLESFDQIKDVAQKVLHNKAKHFIFLDDSPSNIDRARKSGKIHGILFSTADKAEKELRKRLII
jgi:FMN phosphatase YigB (HAD superfamily)